MIKGKDFIITGLQRWDISIGSNAKDIAIEISKNNRVLYVNTPKKECNYYKITQINKSLYVLDLPIKLCPINILPDGFIFDIVNKYNQRRISKYILQAVKELKMDKYIHIIDNDIYNSFFLKEYLDASFTMYYRRDNMSSKYWKKHAPRLEPKLASKCNCVVANSLYLSEAMRQYNNNTYNIGQGVDLSSYSLKIKYDLPKDILSIPRPIIGYVGWITSRRLDIKLIYKLAQLMGNMSFVFVGLEDDDFKNSKIHELKNVYFLGEKKMDLMPNYISQFDVCFNPQIVNSITIGNYPRKIDEYLALGKPIIATKTVTMKFFEDYVWNCETLEDYVASINEAINIKDKKIICDRIAFANAHTWENSVNKLYSHIK